MKVHFASGTHRFPEPWLNIDGHLYPGCEPDRIVDLLNELPDDVQAIDQAYVGHFLEHITPSEGITFLTRVRDRMADDGALMVVGPDAIKGTERLLTGELPAPLYVAIRASLDLTGNQGGAHLWDCHEQAVVDQLGTAGWRDVKPYPIETMPQMYPEWPCINTGGWQFAILARP